jgi:hypothetical protein
MSTGAAFAVAVGAVLFVLAAFFAVRLARTPAATRAAGWAVLRARISLARARASHRAAVRRADLGVRRAERQHTAAIAKLDRRIVELEDPRGSRVVAFGPVILHERSIITPAGEVPLDGVEATVDSAGNMSVTKRATLTRLAVGGLVLGPLGAVLALGFQKKRTHDDRELYLLIEAGPASCVLQVKPDAGTNVRAFAVQVNARARGIVQIRAQAAAELTDVRARLAATREDVSGLDAARQRLADAHQDVRLLGAISDAQAALAGARQRLASAGND